MESVSSQLATSMHILTQEHFITDSITKTRLTCFYNRLGEIKIDTCMHINTTQNKCMDE